MDGFSISPTTNDSASWDREAAASVTAALEYDPFYRSICAGYQTDDFRRREVLTRYFSYSIREGRDFGRCLHLDDHRSGVAVWLLPQSARVELRVARDKGAFLEATLGPEGRANYYRIIDFMSAKAATAVASDAWYLSIIAVDPPLQGRGLGRKLLEPTLAEADRSRAPCYVETFSPRNLSFYERLGFTSVARFAEPTTQADYTLMVRYPAGPTKNAMPERIQHESRGPGK